MHINFMLKWAYKNNTNNNSVIYIISLLHHAPDSDQQEVELSALWLTVPIVSPKDNDQFAADKYTKQQNKGIHFAAILG